MIKKFESFTDDDARDIRGICDDIFVELLDDGFEIETHFTDVIKRYDTNQLGDFHVEIYMARFTMDYSDVVEKLKMIEDYFKSDYSIRCHIKYHKIINRNHQDDVVLSDYTYTESYDSVPSTFDYDKREVSSVELVISSEKKKSFLKRFFQ